ncbi:MAG: hypothetical protein FJ387_26175 [Verrucomicrobia bacterium]|nr:hypothetical protein [Verrucomicrobiota bacterium]
MALRAGPLLVWGWALMAAGANDSPRWRWSNPTPHGAHVYDMATREDLIVQVGERGQIFTSQDLVHWIPRESGTTRALRAATSFGSRLVITGENGTVLFADDPAHVEAGSLDGPTADWLEAVAAGPGGLVAVGDNAAVYTSNDGVAWARQAPGFTNWLRGVTFGAGQWVAVGQGGLVATSIDRRRWSVVRVSGLTQDLNEVAWIDGFFWAVGNGGVVLVTANPEGTWRSLATGASGNLYGVTGHLAETLVVGAGEVRVGQRTLLNYAWTDALDATLPANALPPPNWTYYCATRYEDEYLIAGRSGMTVEGLKPDLLSNQLYWLEVAEPIRNWLWDVAAVGDLYVGVGDYATVLTSQNGVNWELELVPTSVTQAVFLGVGGDTNLLVAVGTGGALMISTNRLTQVSVTNVVNGQPIVTQQTVSELGIVWHAIEPRLTTNDLQGVTAWKGAYYVTGGGGTVLSSTNGLNWTRRPVPTTAFLSSVAGRDAALAVVGDLGTVLTSPNGATWTAETSGTSQWLYRVRAFESGFIALGEDGALLTSANGVRWTARTTGTTRWLNDVVQIDDDFVVVGNQGTVLLSTNTTDWRSLGTLTGKSLYGVAARQGQLVTVGVEGAILRAPWVPRSDPVVIRFARHLGPPGVATNQFGFFGYADQRFTLDSSPGLPVWAPGPRFEFYDASGVIAYSETETNGPPQRFFRARLDR